MPLVARCSGYWRSSGGRIAGGQDFETQHSETLSLISKNKKLINVHCVNMCLNFWFGSIGQHTGTLSERTGELRPLSVSPTIAQRDCSHGVTLSSSPRLAQEAVSLLLFSGSWINSNWELVGNAKS